MPSGPTPLADPPSRRVAIVVTCFNDGETLGAAVVSILDGAPEAELVIVDDGSTDERTLALLSELDEQSGIAVIRQSNQGQARAAMTGLEASVAPYVMRFDADDLLELGAVDALADALDEAPHAAAAWGDVVTTGLTNFRLHGVPALDPWLITYTNCITGSGTLFRRAALVAVGGWQLREGFEDWDLWMALADTAHEGIYVPRLVFRYRRTETGQLATWLSDTARHYDELRWRHKRLFSSRSQNRRNSAAPLFLKVLVPMTEFLPLSRLSRINLCEVLTRVLWGGGLRATLPMVRQGTSIRVRRLVARQHEPA